MGDNTFVTDKEKGQSERPIDLGNRRSFPKSPGSPWALDPDGLRTQNLNQLNVMIAERSDNPEHQQESEADAVKWLSQNFMGAEAYPVASAAPQDSEMQMRLKREAEIQYQANRA